MNRLEKISYVVGITLSLGTVGTAVWKISSAVTIIDTKITEVQSSLKDEVMHVVYTTKDSVYVQVDENVVFKIPMERINEDTETVIISDATDYGGM